MPKVSRAAAPSFHVMAPEGCCMSALLPGRQATTSLVAALKRPATVRRMPPQLGQEHGQHLVRVGHGIDIDGDLRERELPSERGE